LRGRKAKRRIGEGEVDAVGLRRRRQQEGNRNQRNQSNGENPFIALVNPIVGRLFGDVNG
jgi:hypothetical protein